MRIIHIALIFALLAAAPPAALAAGASVSVRAIAFVASNQRGATDSRLAPYEGVLRRNLRYESFRYVGETTATVPAGGSARMSLPDGTRVQLDGENGGNVHVRRGGAVITVSPGRPAVFMSGPAGRGEASGVIVMTQ